MLSNRRKGLERSMSWFLWMVLALSPPSTWNKEYERQNFGGILVVDALVEGQESPRTSLEIVMTRGFNDVVANNQWNRLFGNDPDVQGSSMCTGSPEYWITPALDQVIPGTDLARVIERGTFRCGYIKNLSEGVMQAGNTSDSVSGQIPDFWDDVAASVSDLLNTTITIEWRLYDDAQGVLDGVHTGDSDAACGQWAPDATWVDPNGVTLARGYAFSVMYCPIYFRSMYLFLPTDFFNLTITTFNEYVDFLDTQNETTTNVCVWAAPNSGIERSCNSIFAAVTQSPVVCMGMVNETFRGLQDGLCQSASSSIKPDESIAEQFTQIPQPLALVGGTMFRKNDLSESIQDDADEGGVTSMQLAVTRAFDATVAQGVYADVFGPLDGAKGTTYCSGSQTWPEVPVDEGSDLAALLNRGVFRCGYPADLYYASRDGQVILSTLDPLDVNGAIPEFWEKMIAELGSQYGKDLTVEWTLARTSQDILQDLNDGYIDAACAYFNPDGTYLNENDNVVARGLAFSKLFCIVFAQTDYIYTLEATEIQTFQDLVTSIDSGEASRICVSGARGGGMEQSCNNTFSQYASQPFECVGVYDDSFTGLYVGDCDAVFSGYPPYNPNGPGLYQFGQPTLYSPVTLFRNFDVGFVTRPPTERPTQVPLSPTPEPTPKPTVQPTTNTGGMDGSSDAMKTQSPMHKATCALGLILVALFFEL